MSLKNMKTNARKKGQKADPMRVLSPLAFFGYMVLFSIPIIGWVFLIIFALDNSNICRRNFARSYFIVVLVSVVLWIISGATGLFAHILDYIW